MSERTFTTKEAAIRAGYAFIPAAVIEYVTCYGTVIGKIQRVDVSGGNSFGYSFRIGAYRQTADGWQRVGLFGKSVDLFLTEARNAGGGLGAFCSNVMRRADYVAALRAARAAVGGDDEG